MSQLTSARLTPRRTPLHTSSICSSVTFSSPRCAHMLAPTESPTEMMSTPRGRRSAPSDKAINDSANFPAFALHRLKCGDGDPGAHTDYRKDLSRSSRYLSSPATTTINDQGRTCAEGSRQHLLAGRRFAHHDRSSGNAAPAARRADCRRGAGIAARRRHHHDEVPPRRHVVQIVSVTPPSATTLTTRPVGGCSRSLNRASAAELMRADSVSTRARDGQLQCQDTSRRRRDPWELDVLSK